MNLLLPPTCLAAAGYLDSFPSRSNNLFILGPCHYSVRSGPPETYESMLRKIMKLFITRYMSYSYRVILCYAFVSAYQGMTSFFSFSPCYEWHSKQLDCGTVEGNTSLGAGNGTPALVSLL